MWSGDVCLNLAESINASAKSVLKTVLILLDFDKKKSSLKNILDAIWYYRFCNFVLK